MTSTAVHAGNDQPINFFNLFVSSKRTANKTHDELAHRDLVDDSFQRWFKNSNVIEPVTFKSIPAGEIFGADQVIVKFRLADLYEDQFVLLRGLLEFSRPKEISISSNNSEKTFQFHIGRDKVLAITTYLDKILALFAKEIRFKESLKAVIRFEQATRLEQSRLYRELRTTIQ
jgi:hypothetical protein